MPYPLEHVHFENYETSFALNSTFLRIPNTVHVEVKVKSETSEQIRNKTFVEIPNSMQTEATFAISDEHVQVAMMSCDDDASERWKCFHAMMT